MILINGNFLCRNLTGIERFTWEILHKLDELLKTTDNVSVYVPANAKVIPEFKSIKLIFSEHKIQGFPKWDLIIFRNACKKFKATGLNFSNTAPIGKQCGYSFIHDIYAKDFPDDFTTFKDFLIKVYCRLNYFNISRNAKKVLTVSEFSKKRINEAYKVEAQKIEVINNGWDHFAEITEDENIFKKFPQLQEGNYFFTLGSLQKRKNLKWIVEYAKKHPDELFAISGKAISGMVSNEVSDLNTLKNTIMLGYVSDNEVKALMMKCKAFVFPSYYEGFGIPPLEALSAGAKIIVADSASLPEIYGKSAYYIDSNNSDCNLNELLKKDVSSAEHVLEKYTYKNAALKLYDVLKNDMF